MLSEEWSKFITEFDRIDDISKIPKVLIDSNIFPKECLYYSYPSTKQDSLFSVNKTKLSNFIIKEDYYDNDNNFQLLSLIRQYILDKKISFHTRSLNFLNNKCIEQGFIYSICRERTKYKGVNKLFDYYELPVTLNKDKIKELLSNLKSNYPIHQQENRNGHYICEGLDGNHIDNVLNEKFNNLVSNFIEKKDIYGFNENFLSEIWDGDESKRDIHAVCAAVGAELIYPDSSFFISIPKINNLTSSNGFAAVFVLKQNAPQSVLKEIHVISHMVASKIDKYHCQLIKDQDILDKNKWMKFIYSAKNISLNEILTKKEDNNNIITDKVNELLEKITVDKLIPNECVYYSFVYKSLNKDYPIIINKKEINDVKSHLISISRKFRKDNKLYLSSNARIFLQEEENDKGIICCITDNKSQLNSSDYYDYYEINIDCNNDIKNKIESLLKSCEENNENYDELEKFYYEKSREYINVKPLESSYNSKLMKIFGHDVDINNYCSSWKLTADAFGNDFMVVIITPNNIRLTDRDYKDIGGISCMFVIKKESHQNVLDKLYFFASTISEKIIIYNLLLSFAPLYSYKSGLSVFSHGCGKYFQESGLLSLEPDIEKLDKFIKEELDRKELGYLVNKLRMLEKTLSLAWGIQTALSVADKGFKISHFDSENFYSSEYLISSFENIIFVFLAGQINAKLTNLEDKNIFLGKIIMFNGELYTPKEILDTHINKNIIAIPPFNEKAIDASLAVVCGLLELIRNACSAVFSEGNMEDMLDYIDKRKTALLFFSIEISNNKDIFVIIKNVTRSGVKSTPQSIENIINLEKNSTGFINEGKSIVKTIFNGCINDNEYKIAEWKWEYYINTNPPKPKNMENNHA